MVKGSWKQIYPKDCYRVLLGICSETGLSFPKVVNITVREGLIRLDKIKESTSQAYLLKPKPLEEPQPRTKAEIKRQKKLKELEKRFSQVIEQWPKLSEKAKLYHIAEAEKYEASVPNAKFVLALANGNSKPVVVCGKVSLKAKEVETK